MTEKEDRPRENAEATSPAQDDSIVAQDTDDLRLRNLAAEGGMVTAALEWAAHGWPVFPTWGKKPAIPGAHRPHACYPTGCADSMEIIKDPRRGRCKGECGQLGHGVWDATTDPEVVREMWSGVRQDCTISCRVPYGWAYLDVDPRHGGDETWARILAAHDNDWPDCETHVSGRGDGGVHLWVQRPPGKVVNCLGAGVEFKHAGAAGVLPPSIHEETGGRYRLVEGPIPAPPAWFVQLVTVAPTVRPESGRRSLIRRRGRAVADDYCESVSWHDVLEPHGWECLDYDGDYDGARWRHPEASTSHSATISNGSLYVYSTSTDFEATLPGKPCGYSKFRAYAVLTHGGDMRAAARALRKVGAA